MDHKPASAVSRRKMLKRSAVAGGALVWAVPLVETFGQGVASASAPGGSPRVTRRVVLSSTDSNGNTHDTPMTCDWVLGTDGNYHAVNCTFGG
jgi:hypothetical protein